MTTEKGGGSVEEKGDGALVQFIFRVQPLWKGSRGRYRRPIWRWWCSCPFPWRCRWRYRACCPCAWQTPPHKERWVHARPPSACWYLDRATRVGLKFSDKPIIITYFCSSPQPCLRVLVSFSSFFFFFGYKLCDFNVFVDSPSLTSFFRHQQTVKNLRQC